MCQRVLLFVFSDGPLSCGAAADLGHHVRERARDGVSALVLDFTRVPFIDLSAAMAVRTIIADATAAGRDVHLTAANEAVNEILTGLGIGRPEGRVRHWASRLEAIRHAVSVLDNVAAASPRPQT